MRKLRQFQELGHDVTFLIGTFTGIIGDPSDKESVRRQQTLDEALQKATTYADQAWIVLDKDRTSVRYNHEWLADLNFANIVSLASNFTVQQFLVRENFAKRYANGDAVWLHEFFYALMQGYDAVALKTDVQVGGSDQLFNLMAGRKLMESFGLKPQIVLTSRILVGTDGVQRMSKSIGNHIGISEPPGIIFTKVLNVPDSAMRNYAELITRWPLAQIDGYFAQIARGELTMREFKHLLAAEIVSIFHGDEAARQAGADNCRYPGWGRTGQEPERGTAARRTRWSAAQRRNHWRHRCRRDAAGRPGADAAGREAALCASGFQLENRFRA
jgi:tyrosyl-tRNA synthetase